MTDPMPDPPREDAAPAAPEAPATPPGDAPDAESPAITPGWHALPAAATRVGMIAGALAAAPVALPITLLLGGTLRLGAGRGTLLALALAALAAVVGAAWGRARTRRTSWRLDARGLQVRRGLLWQGEVLVPRSRVQHLDIERGPIERRFGLATLVVHTAGTRLSALRQGGLPDADAVALRDALVPEPGDDDL